MHLIDHMGMGGAQRIIADLANSGLGDVVFALREKGNIVRKLPNEVLSYSGGVSPICLIKSLIKLDQIIHDEKIEIIHCHLRISFFVGLVLSLKHKDVKFVFHEHGWVLLGKLIYSVLLRVLPKRGVILACSELLGKSVRLTGYRRILIVLHNFIDLESYYPDQSKRKEFRDNRGFGENDILIGFAGRLVKDKGWSDLIYAFSALETDENMVLMIVGIGPDEKRIERMIIELGLESRVRLVGYEGDMPSFYNGMDIVVNPTKLEAFGLVQLEAQACGVPVIASNLEGVRETVDQSCAVLVPPGDSAAIALEMRKLIVHPELREELSRKGLMNVQRFSKDVYLRKLRDVYRNL
jgi:glycosyltransferase involved in cell wall biosynthesis